MEEPSSPVATPKAKHTMTSPKSSPKMVTPKTRPWLTSPKSSPKTVRPKTSPMVTPKAKHTAKRMMTSLPKSCPKMAKPNTCIAEDTCIAVTSAGLMVPKVKCTETLHGEFIKTTLLHSADGKLTGIARSKIRLQHRRRRWNVPLHLEARAIKAQAEISQQFLHQMHNFFRMTPGGLDAVLRESATWPELPDWLKRLG